MLYGITPSFGIFSGSILRLSRKALDPFSFVETRFSKPFLDGKTSSVIPYNTACFLRSSEQSSISLHVVLAALQHRLQCAPLVRRALAAMD